MTTAIRFAGCAGLTAVIALGPCACCCRDAQFAELYVTSDPPLAAVTDLKTGEYFGETPVTHIVTRADCTDRTMQLLITHPLYRSSIETVILTEWSSEAETAELNGTRIHALLNPIVIDYE